MALPTFYAASGSKNEGAVRLSFSQLKPGDCVAKGPPSNIRDQQGVLWFVLVSLSHGRILAAYSNIYGRRLFEVLAKLTIDEMGCINGKFTDDVDPRRNAQSITPVFRLANDGIVRVDGVREKPVIAAANTNCNNVKKKMKFDAVVTSKYEFKKLIGEGTFTRVWMVEDRRTKQPYAIKIAAGGGLGRECVDAEIVIVSRLKHPNVIHFMEVLSTARATYMVMELATGGDLFDRIEAQGSFAEPDAVRVLKMVLSGVMYLHGCGIVHRDIKLDNLLFYHPGLDSKILIADFALAVRPDRSTKDGGTISTPCGTPEYVAPEVVAKRAYTCAVDVWAVGVVAYTVLSSTFPFDADTLDELGELILAGNYAYDEQLWTSVSDCAKNFIDCLLVRDPKCRLTAAQALRHPWIRCGGGDGCDDHLNANGLRRTISSGSSSVASSSSSSGRSVSTAIGSSSRRRRRRLQRRTRQRQQEALQNDPEWNEFRHTILASVGAVQS